MVPIRPGPTPGTKGSNYSCHLCGQLGHYKAECPRLRQPKWVAATRLEEDPSNEHVTFTGDITQYEEVNDDRPQDDMEPDGPINSEYPSDMPCEGQPDDIIPLWDDDIDCETQTEYCTNMVLTPESKYNIRKRVFMTKYMNDNNCHTGAPSAPEQPMYDHRLKPKDRDKLPRQRSKAQTLDGYWEIGGVRAHCLLDSGCEGIMMSPEFARAARIGMFPLEHPVNLQLAVVGSRSVVNYGTNSPIRIGALVTDEYFDIANVDYYDVILGTPFLNEWGIILDFSLGQIRIGNDIIPNNKTSSNRLKTTMPNSNVRHHTSD